jgi:hypothetical protein
MSGDWSHGLVARIVARPPAMAEGRSWLEVGTGLTCGTRLAEIEGQALVGPGCQCERKGAGAGWLLGWGNGPRPR